MFEGVFDDAEIAVPCPECGKENQRTLGSLRAQDQFNCAGCGKLIAPDATDLNQGVGAAEQALDNLRKSLRSFGKP